MRGIYSPVKTYSVTLGGSSLQQSSEVLPGFGALEGLLIELTVSLTGATASQTCNTIDNVIASLQLDDKYGHSTLDINGTDIANIQRVLSETGYVIAAPTITTSSTGNLPGHLLADCAGLLDPVSLGFVLPGHLASEPGKTDMGHLAGGLSPSRLAARHCA